MSILIKGVEMPKGCYRGCPCYSFHYCNVLRRDTSAVLGTGKKLDDCPLVPVPQHGRLIDADALLGHMKKIHDKWKMEGHYTPTTDDELMAMNMPTIIEAEGDGQ